LENQLDHIVAQNGILLKRLHPLKINLAQSLKLMFLSGLAFLLMGCPAEEPDREPLNGWVVDEHGAGIDSVKVYRPRYYDSPHYVYADTCDGNYCGFSTEDGSYYLQLAFPYYRRPLSGCAFTPEDDGYMVDFELWFVHPAYDTTRAIFRCGSGSCGSRLWDFSDEHLSRADTVIMQDESAYGTPGGPWQVPTIVMKIRTENDWDSTIQSTSYANIQQFDSYSDNQKIKLYWTTGWSIGPTIGDPPTPVEKVAVLMSLVGPDTGFNPVFQSTRDGHDSTIVTDLENGRLYYFRLMTFDSLDVPLGTSRPLMTRPAPIHDTIITTPARQPGSPQWESGIDWSPDGSELAFVRTVDFAAGPNVYILDLASESVRQITQYSSGYSGHRLLDVAWQPNGSYLAYGYSPTSTAGSIDYRIWIVPANIPQPIPKSVTGGRVDFDPAWADDNVIYFCKGTPGPPNIPEIMAVDISGSAINEIPFSSDQSIRKYSLHINSMVGSIVFCGMSLNTGSASIYQTSIDEYSPIILLENQYWDDIHPAWGPDGNSVLFASNRSGHFELWTFDVNTQELRQITRGLQKGVERYHGKISPDGTKIAFIETGPEDQKNDIHLCIMLPLDI
jgi:Tol biopolymer transport system component